MRTFIKLFLICLILGGTGCNSYRYVSKEQKRRVKYTRKLTELQTTVVGYGQYSGERNWRPEYFYYSDTEIFHVDSYGQHTRLTWNDIQTLGIDSLRVQYLEMNAERE